jgi:PAS domain S-box-containing protein
VSLASHLVSALDVLPDGLLLVGATGTIDYANGPAYRMFGYEADVLVGRPIEVLVPMEARSPHRRSRSQFEQGPELRPMGRDDLDIEGRKADGTIFPVDIQLSPLPSGNGVVAAFVRDMTKQRGAAVDRALDRLDLTAARERNTQLVASHDLMVQRLFALAAHLEAQRGSASFDSTRFARAIDELIAVIRREALGEGPPDSP